MKPITYLAIDLGNTRCKMALFDAQGVLLRHWVKPNLEKAWLKRCLKRYAVGACILSSVRRGLKKIKAFLAKRCEHFLYLSHETSVPIQNDYETPQTLGRDRLAAVVGANALFPGQACLVVNAGTCITYDLVDAQGVYRGGSIAPGLQMRFKALPQFTAKLPLIEAQPMPIELTGKSTETAIRTGVQWGMVHEVDGFIEAYRRLYPELRVVLAGGDATYFEITLKNSIFAQPNLVLLGLYQILVYNVQQTPFPPAAL